MLFFNSRFKNSTAVGTLRPHYLLQEFLHFIAIAAYVPLSANTDAACDVLQSVVSRLNNPCPLGRSDHSLVHLLPVYKPLVHRQPAVTRTVKRWTDETDEALRDESSSVSSQLCGKNCVRVIGWTASPPASRITSICVVRTLHPPRLYGASRTTSHGLIWI